MPGVEPGSQAWEAGMMPLHYMRHVKKWDDASACVWGVADDSKRSAAPALGLTTAVRVAGCLLRAVLAAGDKGASQTLGAGWGWGRADEAATR